MKYLMSLLQYAPYLFIVSLLSGQLIRIPFLNGVIYPHDILLALCLIVGVMYRPKQVQLRIPQSIKKMFIGFVMLLLVTILIQGFFKEIGMVYIGLSYVARFLYYIIGSFFLVKFYPNMPWGKYLFVFGTVFSILGIIQFTLYPDLRNLMYLGWDPHYYRLFSTLLDPNFAGIMIVLTIILGNTSAIQIRHKSIIVFSQIINIAALLLTLSRSSFIAAFISILLLIILNKRRMWMFLLIITGIASIFLRTPGGSILSELRQITAMARIENWQESIKLIASSPVIGHGFYMLKSISEGSTLAFAYLDNSFLFVFATAGIVGFIAFGLLYLLLLKYSFIFRNKNPYTEVLFFSLIALLVHSQFVNSLFYPWVLLWVGILIAESFRSDPSAGSGQAYMK